MKPEDAAQQYEAAMNDAHATVNGRFNGIWCNLNEDEREWLLRFASAIESHVRAETVAMCKEKARPTFNPHIDWSAVDAAVKDPP